MKKEEDEFSKEHIQKIDDELKEKYPDKTPIDLAEVLAMPGFKTVPKKKNKKRNKT